MGLFGEKDSGQPPEDATPDEDSGEEGTPVRDWPGPKEDGKSGRGKSLEHRRQDGERPW